MSNAPQQVSAPFEGRVVIVTGGTKGIGRAIAEEFLGAGATVVVCARSEPDSLPHAEGRSAVFMQCDVRTASACKELLDRVGAEYGRVDVLVNNAGGSPHVDAATVSPRFSDAIINLNLMAPVYLSQAAYQWMARLPEGGSIINIASVSARRPSPGTAVYGAAKAGLLSLTTSLAQEWAPKVRVNAIIVGLIETEKADETYGSREAQQAIAASVPMKRMGRGEDIAKAALYLANPSATFVTGATLEVHGGGETPLFLDLIKRYAATKDAS